MINYDKQVVSALKSVLPTHYEMALTSKNKTPCLSYMELNNSVITEPIGASLGYSSIIYQVKIWSIDIAEIKEYSIEVDKVMRELGFSRISANEIYDNNSSMIQKILTYEALALENF